MEAYWGIVNSLAFPLLGLVLAYILYIQVSARSNDKATTLPSYPIVGSFFAFWKNRRRLPDWITENLSKAPSHTITIERLGTRKTIVTANPANIEHLLKTRFENYPKGDFFSSILRDLLGTGIFNVDGEHWKLQRKVASFEFNTRSLRDFITEVVQGEITHRLLPLLRKAAGEEKTRLDVQDVLKRFAFDNICKVAFGTDPACLDISLPVSQFAYAFDLATHLSCERFVAPLQLLWKVKRVLNVGTEKRLSKAIRAIHEFAQEVIQTRKIEISLSHQDLLSRFLSLDRSAAGVEDQGSYDDFVRDIVISFVLAGRDTSSAALTWFFWLLSSHPEVEQRINLEITSVIAGREAVIQEGEMVFSFEELKHMKYLHACICESMRLYPPVPSDSKEALQDDVLPDGTVVCKGVRVIYHPYAMGRMQSIWGTDCLEFKPERWLKQDDNGSLLVVKENVFKYPVFQAGPRICLGKEMAFIQMKSIAASVLREFKFKVDPDFKPKFVATLTAKMETGLPVRVEKREHLKGI
ncbi:hypothetical protein SUGI_1142660 [Cryptomeria japonica]|uniref:cytochrome P450 94B3-like n=1 Tax=Cryptomeria japonica TaxID=3369 RepID=UPI002414CAB2|nr:cytochrome P450 94B3-like [Cryptomeria japonica]GLJ53567.1 hypothetical protein SUGI_1142660 [Cryptomeria japonica]